MDFFAINYPAEQPRMDLMAYSMVNGEDLDHGETDVSLVPADNYIAEAVELQEEDLSSVSLNLIPDEVISYDRARSLASSSSDRRKFEDCLRLIGPPRFAGLSVGDRDSPVGVTETARVTLRLPSGLSSHLREADYGRNSGPPSAASPSPSRLAPLSDRPNLNSSIDFEPTDLLSRLKAASASQSPAKSPAVIRGVSDSFAISSISPSGPSRTAESPKAGQPVAASEVQISNIEHEGRVLARVSDLRKLGKWEDSRLPKCIVAEPFSRGVKNFTKEVTWVATLIAKEKKAKMVMAKKIAYAAKRWHERRAEKIRRAEREEEQRLRKTAKTIGGLVHAWWVELGKVAQLKQKEEIEIRKKDIRALHLKHLMDQTEEFSSRMAQGLAKSSSQASLTQSETTDTLSAMEDPTDKEFELEDDDSVEDEEDTISDEEATESIIDNQMDAKRLEDEANIPLEDLLPPEYREKYFGGQVADEPPAKRKRTSSRTLSTDMYELEPKQKKMKDDDLSQLVDLSADSNLPSTSHAEPDNQLDSKIKSNEERLERLKPKGNSLASTEVVTKVPLLLRGDLREYQHVGLDWLASLYNNKMNGILADEMGLGKTIQTIAFIAHLASEQGNWGPHLVIVPTSVLLNWELEFKRWCPGLIIKTYYGSRKQRENLRTGWTKPDSFHICITSYKVATQDYTSFRRMRWHYLILDEAQAIKNYKSQRWMRIAEFPSQRRLLLTGTPMQNSLEEVWALLHFLAPELFESLNMFQQLFSNLTAMSEGRKPQDQAIIKQLHTVLRPFILRRMKSEVEQQLPKKYEQVLKCRLSKRQRYLYDDYMSRSKTKETLKAGNYLSVINILMQLRKVCNHPNLFEERPVLSPLVVHPLTVKLPALVFDVIYKDTEDAPYFREVSTILTRPFSAAPKNLMSFESSRLVELIPADEKLLTAADPTKELSLPRPLPTDFSTLFDTLGFSVTDLMAGTPFVMDDERLCNGGCKHPLPPPIRSYNTVTTVHMGRAKRSARKKGERKNGLTGDGGLTNGVKRARIFDGESESSRITTKYFAEDVLPSRFRQQREDHCEVLVFGNRRKCLLRPLLPENVLNLVTLRQDLQPRMSFATGSLQCRLAQEETRRSLPFQEKLSGLMALTELGSAVEKRLEQPEEWYWIEHGSVAYMPVIAPPPVLDVRNLPSRVSDRFDSWAESVAPMLQDVATILHPVERLSVMKFPETRLIQYDCGKLQKLDELLRERFRGGHRCLIFTQMTRVLDILEIFLTYHGHKYLRLDGSTGIELRQTLMDRFNRDPRYFCFILSTRSGGVGVNLTGADTVIFYDSDWNPTMDAQAQDRCHRIGQTRDVNIYRLISEFTVEENIFEKASQKKYLGHLAIESGSFTTAVLKKENFKDIFGLKDDEVSDDIGGETTEAAIESALSKVEDADDVEAAKKAKTEAAVDDEDEDDDDDTPKFKSLEKYLSPIQCFGLKYLEDHIINQDVMEELEQTREEVERRKREWELNRLEIAKAEKLKMKEDASDPFLVSRSLLDPKFYQDLLTLQHPKECQDEDMPLFDFREASPSSDKENSSDLHITDYSPWGTLYRNPPPELAMPMLKNKSRLKKGKNNKMMPDSLMGPKSTRRKKDQLMPLNFDSPGSRGLRGTSHMGMARELSSMELPDSLIGSESVAPDWRPFEDWQIVMTSAMLQGVPQNPQQVLPTVTATSCELTSYVTSTVNPKYRQSRECQLRLRAIRTREEKDSSGDVVAPPKKKKKTKLEETLAVDKTMFPVPKRAVQALQEDNGRSRTQLYRDFFSAFRSQTYNPPSQRRESSANQRAGAGAWSSSVFLESGIALDDPVTPLTMLKRKMDRSSMSKNFVTETAYRWAQTMNMTVDAHGQRAETHLLSPQQKSNSILQQTLQAAAPRTPTAANMPLLSAVVAGTAAPAQTPLPSPQYMAMGTGIPSAVRRQVQFPSTNSPSPAPPSSSPLPSIGSTSLTQFIGNQPIAGKTIPVQINTINVPTPPVVNNTSETAVVPSSSLPVAVQSAVAPNTQQQQAPPAAAPPRGPQEQLSVDRARQLQVLRNIFTLPRGQQTFTGQDLARIREYLSNRGIQFSDAQLSDLVRAFASKTGAGGAPTQTAAPAMVDGGGAGGGGVQTYQVVQQQQQPQQQQVTITGPGNQMVQAPAVLTAVSSGPRQLNYRGVVRGAQSTGPATISLNFAQMQSSQIQQPQAPQTIRPQIVNTTKRVAVSSALPLAANKNGPITIPQGKPAAAVMTSQNVAILPNPNRTGLPPVNMNPDQVKQATYYNPRLANVITSTPGESLSLRRQMTPITIPIATGQPGQMQPVYIQFAVDNKPIIPDPAATAASKRDQNSTPPTPGSGSLPEPN